MRIRHGIVSCGWWKMLRDGIEGGRVGIEGVDGKNRDSSRPEHPP